MSTDIDRLTTDIVRGLHDDDLDEISEAIKARRKLNGKIDGMSKFAALQVGDRVTLSATARPKYLAGVSATVTKKNRTRVVIDLDERAGRFHTNITAPPELLDLSA